MIEYHPAPEPGPPPPLPVDPAQFGKGCLPTPEELKAGLYVLAATVVPPTDWNVPYRVPVDLIQKHQDGSSSCTAQATDYYVEALGQIQGGPQEHYSSRFIYSQTFVTGGGAYIWKAMSIPLIQGVADFDSVPVPGGVETEAIMTDPSDNVHAVLKQKTDKYAQLATAGRNMDYLASIVRDYHGFITGFNGWDGMFSPDGTVVDWSRREWGHAVYIIGYEMHNGQKCLVFKNSWGSLWGDHGYGYLPEAFLTSGMVFDAFVYAAITDLDPTTVTLTRKHVSELQALEGYHDEEGIKFWSGETDGVKKVLADYLAARLPDKVKTINDSLALLEAPTPVVIPPTIPPIVPPIPVPTPTPTPTPLPPQPPVIVKDNPSTPVNPISLDNLGSVLAGVGLAKLDSNLTLGLILVGTGVLLHVLKAVLNHYGIPVSAH